MWNPETYRDTDYGLDPDESFEPEELDHEYPEPPEAAPHIQTVLGRIDPQDAGLALVREHLHRNPPAAEPEHQLTDRNAALLDLETFFTVGGRTVVDATTNDEGRSIDDLVWLAQRAPLHIVASTGGMIDSRSTNTEIRKIVDMDRTEGEDEPSGRPGLIVLGFGPTLTVRDASSAFAVLAEETHQCPLPVMILTDDSPLSPLDVAKAAVDEGVEAHRLIVRGEFQARDGIDRAGVAQLGAYLLFDRLGEGTYEHNMATASRIANLVEAGHGQQLLMSHGYDQRSLLTGYGGGPGLGYIVEQFAIMLLEAGASALDVRTMLLDNSAAALTIQPKPS